MSTATSTENKTTSERKVISSKGIFDVEIHAEIDHLKVAEYLPKRYKDRFLEGFGGHGILNFDQRGGGNRRDVIIGAPGRPDIIRQDILDPYDIRRAILTGISYDTSIYADTDFWNAKARALNKSLMEDFVPQDETFYGTIRLNMNDPDAAVAEIEHWADHPRLAGIIASTASTQTPGARSYDRVFAAAAEAGLVISYHTTQEGRGLCPPPSSAGYPSRYIEYHSGLATSAIGHATSMLTNGVFARHPKLKIIYLEGGISWALPLLWSLDADWKRFREEVPILKEPPSHYLSEHVYFTTQPIEEPPNGQDLLAVYEEIGLDKNILYSTDYAHWDFDPPDRFLPSCFSQEQRERILWDNAHDLYAGRVP